MEMEGKELVTACARTHHFNSYFLALASASLAARLHDNALELDVACVDVSTRLLYKELVHAWRRS